MKHDLQQIPDRIRELREILEISTVDMASRLGIDTALYEDFECGKADLAISALYEIAAVLDVDLTVLLTGKSPRMDVACVVRDGHGVKIERYPGYDFESLAYNFKKRRMEPLMVSLNPSDESPALVSHKGQEFNYVVQGTICVTIGSKSHVLEMGDCIYFNPTMPHGQAAVNAPAKFLSIILED